MSLNLKKKIVLEKEITIRNAFDTETPLHEYEQMLEMSCATKKDRFIIKYIMGLSNIKRSQAKYVIS